MSDEIGLAWVWRLGRLEIGMMDYYIGYIYIHRFDT